MEKKGAYWWEPRLLFGCVNRLMVLTLKLAAMRMVVGVAFASARHECQIWEGEGRVNAVFRCIASPSSLLSLWSYLYWCGPSEVLEALCWVAMFGYACDAWTLVRWRVDSASLLIWFLALLFWALMVVLLHEVLLLQFEGFFIFIFIFLC